MKKLLPLGILALALSAATADAAQVFVRFGPPPPPREIVVVHARPGHAWVPGYYQWRGNRYHWRKGYWAKPPRRGAAWVPGYWTPRRGGHIWISGYWR